MWTQDHTHLLHEDEILWGCLGDNSLARPINSMGSNLQRCYLENVWCVIADGKEVLCTARKRNTSATPGLKGSKRHPGALPTQTGTQKILSLTHTLLLRRASRQWGWCCFRPFLGVQWIWVRYKPSHPGSGLCFLLSLSHRKETKKGPNLKDNDDLGQGHSPNQKRWVRTLCAGPSWAHGVGRLIRGQETDFCNQLYNMVEQNYILFHPALAFSLDEGTVSAPWFPGTTLSRTACGVITGRRSQWSQGHFQFKFPCSIL